MKSTPKLTIEWTVACARVIVDQQTGEWSLIDVIERVMALQFPAQHQRFAIAARVSTEAAPGEDLSLRYRVVRTSDADGEQTILESRGRWLAGTDRGRFHANFAVLRLFRPERLRFRVDVATDDGPWQMGATTSIDVAQMELTAEQAAQFESEMKKLLDLPSSAAGRTVATDDSETEPG
ncbi:MAG: hypothetical protein H6747_00425 [Deltaproteobacteria bacterium]|nr:hypothetical protein [Deltaproteobacteria bacterium]